MPFPGRRMTTVAAITASSGTPSARTYLAPVPLAVGGGRRHTVAEDQDGGGVSIGQAQIPITKCSRHRQDPDRRAVPGSHGHPPLEATQQADGILDDMERRHERQADTRRGPSPNEVGVLQVGMDQIGPEIAQYRCEHPSGPRIPPGAKVEAPEVDTGATQRIGIAVPFRGHEADHRHLHPDGSGDTGQVDQQVFGATAAQIVDDVTDLHAV